MTVYVDPIFEVESGPWCHMAADSEAELDAFARSIGCALSWKHEGGTGRWPHYDLRPSMRTKAVRRGAREVTGKELIHILRGEATVETVSMRAISLWQPYAQLMAIGAKKFETRHWSTKYRGPIAIHAAKRADRKARDPFHHIAPIRAALGKAGYHNFDDLPLGAVVAIGELTKCYDAMVLATRNPGSPELAFGHYAPGRFGWHIQNVRMLAEPYPVRGQQGLFTVELPKELVA